MKKTNLRSVFSLVLMTVLIAAMTLTTGCGNKTTAAATAAETTVTEAETTAAETTEEEAETTAEEAEAADVTVLGTGAVTFDLTVTDADGNTTYFEIHTDEENVGDALLGVELVEGEVGEYGLYIKTVNGINADYDTDGSYWAFYINGEYAMTGVSETPINEGDSFTLQVEK